LFLLLLHLPQIIALANLRHKGTHSAQTLASGFRREGCSQTWLPKEAAVQTRVSQQMTQETHSPVANTEYQISYVCLAVVSDTHRVLALL
jgi:hypothetical protein